MKFLHIVHCLLWKIVSLKDRSDLCYKVHFLTITKMQGQQLKMGLQSPDPKHKIQSLSKETCNMHIKPSTTHYSICISYHLSVTDGIINTYKQNNLLQNSKGHDIEIKWAKLRDREHHPLMHVHWTFQSSSERRGVPTPLVVAYCPTIWKIAWLNYRSHRSYTVHFLPITKVQRLTTPDGFQVWAKKVATCMTNPSQCITAHVFDNIGRSWQHNQHLQVFPNSWNSTESEMG